VKRRRPQPEVPDPWADGVLRLMAERDAAEAELAACVLADPRRQLNVARLAGLRWSMVGVADRGEWHLWASGYALLAADACSRAGSLTGVPPVDRDKVCRVAAAAGAWPVRELADLAFSRWPSPVLAGETRHAVGVLAGLAGRLAEVRRLTERMDAVLAGESVETIGAARAAA
jgi:hypothetical protein